jgi:cell division protein FtsL
LRNQHYGNLAVKLNQTESQKNSQPSKQIKQEKQSYGISVGEKLLYLLSIIVIVCILGFIISRYSLVSQMNYQIEKTKESVKNIQEQNSTLKLKIDELSKRERILDIAQRELGMTAQDNVKVLSR